MIGNRRTDYEAIAPALHETHIKVRADDVEINLEIEAPRSSFTIELTDSQVRLLIESLKTALEIGGRND